MTWLKSSTVAALTLLASCGQANRAEAPAGNQAAQAAPRPPATVAAQAAAPPAPAPTAAPAYILAANGLQPGIAFHMPRAAAIAAATAAFGAPTGNEHSDDCGEGAMDFTKFHGLWLGFRGGRLVGWSLDQAAPALHTAHGLAVGAPRSALGTAEVDEESSYGPEFEVDGIGGVLDEHGRRIASLWAGDTCRVG